MPLSHALKTGRQIDTNKNAAVLAAAFHGGQQINLEVIEDAFGGLAPANNLTCALTALHLDQSLAPFQRC